MFNGCVLSKSGRIWGSRIPSSHVFIQISIYRESKASKEMYEDNLIKDATDSSETVFKENITRISSTFEDTYV